QFIRSVPVHQKSSESVKERRQPFAVVQHGRRNGNNFILPLPESLTQLVVTCCRFRVPVQAIGHTIEVNADSFQPGGWVCVIEVRSRCAPRWPDWNAPLWFWFGKASSEEKLRSSQNRKAGG